MEPLGAALSQPILSVCWDCSLLPCAVPAAYLVLQGELSALSTVWEQRGLALMWPQL